MSIRLLSLIAALLLIPPLSAAANDDWQYRVTPYLWFAGLKGDIGTIPGQPSAPVNVSPSEALEDTEIALMLQVDAKREGRGLFVDLFYSDVRSDFELIPQPIGLTLRSVTKTTLLSVAYQYEMYRQDSTVIDMMIGARYWKIDSELQFGNGLGFLAGRTLNNDESWIDPAIGLKGQMRLGDSAFYVEGGAGLGGFGIGSDLFYELSGSLGYQWTPSIGTAIGYRMFNVDYDDSGFVYDVRQEGLQVGLAWAF